MKYLLSVDGGGTKTEFCISDIKGNIIKSILTGSSNYKSVGIKTVLANLQQGMTAVLESLEIDIEDIAFSVWGISGCDSEYDFKILEDVIKEIKIPVEKMYLCNDGVLAFYAQSYEPGIVIISGTGSIVIGIDQNGKVERSGGWGYNISDIGSGYWIGNEAIKQTLLYCDGCMEYSPLYDQIRKYFEAANFHELPYIITEVTNYYEIAKIARIVVESSEKNIESATSILKKGAGVLAKMVSNTYNNLGFNTTVDLNFVFSGGVLKSSVYQKILVNEIGKQLNLKNINFTMQENSPVYGGIKLAVKLADRGDHNAL